MAAVWGTGRTASSDGQFFPAGGRGEALNLVKRPVRVPEQAIGLLPERVIDFTGMRSLEPGRARCAHQSFMSR